MTEELINTRRIISSNSNKQFISIYKYNNLFPTYIDVLHGGIGITSYTIGDIITAESSTILTTISAVASGYALISNGVNSKPIYGKINLSTMIDGVLSIANYGTNLSSYTKGDILYASAPNILNKLSTIAIGQVLLSGGIETIPYYGLIDIDTYTTGLLPVANGGLNLTTYTTGDIIYASTSGVLSKLSDIATGNVLLSQGVGVAPSYGKADLSICTTGTLSSTNGGTNSSSYTIGDLIYATATNVLGRLSDVAIGSVLLVGTNINYAKITLNSSFITGTLPVDNGGTNITSYTVGSMIYATGSLTLAQLLTSTSGLVLISGGVGAAPSYGSIDLSTFVTGNLPISKGGFPSLTTTTGDLLIANSTSSFSVLPDVAVGSVLMSNGAGVAPSYQTVSLTSNISGILPSANGGLGSTVAGTVATGNILIGNGFNTLDKLSVTAFPQRPLLAGASTLSYASLTISSGTNVTGILPLSNGGTGVNASGLSNGICYISSSLLATIAAVNVGVANSILRYNTSTPAYEWIFTQRLVGYSQTSTSAIITCNTALPSDDTIPQSGEGDSILSFSYTAASAASSLFFRAHVSGNNSTNVTAIMALFSTTSANALTANYISQGAVSGNGTIYHYILSIGSTSARTYTLRVGAPSGTYYVNGDSAGGAKFGGTLTSFLEVYEYNTS